jgi:hypothetical protein
MKKQKFQIGDTMYYVSGLTGCYRIIKETVDNIRKFVNCTQYNGVAEENVHRTKKKAIEHYKNYLSDTHRKNIEQLEEL